MAKVRFVGSEPHIVAELGERLVEPDDVVTVPDARFDAYLLTPSLWEAVEEPKTAAAPAAKKTAAKSASKEA